MRTRFSPAPDQHHNLQHRSPQCRPNGAVTDQNGDARTALQSPLGGNISKPITGETTYTLSCLGLDGTTLTKTATVKIIPTFQEK
jgi:hypothetical protein